MSLEILGKAETSDIHAFAKWGCDLKKRGAVAYQVLTQSNIKIYFPGKT